MNNFILFLSISGGEILVILLVVYLVFGPKKIPELARMIGKGMNELRRATDDIKREITKETGSLRKEMDIGIDLKDPLDFMKKGNPNKENSSFEGKQSTTEPEDVEGGKVEDQMNEADTPQDENLSKKSPKGSMPRN